MKKIISTILVALAITTNGYSQDSFSDEYYFPLSFVVNGNIGVFSTQTEDFQVTNRPMLSTSALFGINPNLFLGGGIGVGTWNMKPTWDGTVEDKYFNVPIYATARYFFGERRKMGMFFDAKIGYRLGNKVKMNMLTERRTGEDYRIIAGHGLYSSIVIGMSFHRIELSMGMDIQGLNYDVVDHSIVTGYYRKPRNREETVTTTERAFIFQLGYWF